jgi:glutathione S-transferase
VKLYSSRFAPSPRRVRMYAAEKGIALEIVEVDIAKREHEAPAYRAVNPAALLPTLERDDGSRLTESLAICRWLEELHPEPDLFGRSADERAAVNSCIDRLMFGLYVPTTHAFRHTHSFWADRLRQVPEWGELERARARAFYGELERTLATREFVALERFTMADIVAFTSVDFGKVAGLRPTEAEPHLARYQAAIGARPSARA